MSEPIVLPVLASRRHVEHDAVLGAIPHPVLVLAEDDRVVYANAASEQFLSTSIALLKRQTLKEHFGQSSPLVALMIMSGISFSGNCRGP